MWSGWLSLALKKDDACVGFIIKNKNRAKHEKHRVEHSDGACERDGRRDVRTWIDATSITDIRLHGRATVL